MGRADRNSRSKTLPPSPSHSFSSSSSSSSSDFEFTISLSPRKSSSNLCPADELFYKGQILPLHLSPRLSMVRTLLLSSSSTSSDTTTTASRDSTASSNSTDSNSSFSSDLVLLAECESSRPSSVNEEYEFKRIDQHHQIKKNSKYFSLARISSVFRKDSNKNRDQVNVSGSSVKEVIRKYLKKVKPLYEKLSQKQQQQEKEKIATTKLTERSVKNREISSGPSTRKDNNGIFCHSFSGNLRYPRRKSCVSSCPSSMRSSPNHSGVLSRSRVIGGSTVGGVRNPDSSSMEELQNAIQGAIAHCKNSMAQTKSLVREEI